MFALNLHNWNEIHFKSFWANNFETVLGPFREGI